MVLPINELLSGVEVAVCVDNAKSHGIGAVNKTIVKRANSCPSRIQQSKRSSGCRWDSASAVSKWNAAGSTPRRRRRSSASLQIKSANSPQTLRPKERQSPCPTLNVCRWESSPVTTKGSKTGASDFDSTIVPLSRLSLYSMPRRPTRDHGSHRNQKETIENTSDLIGRALIELERRLFEWSTLFSWSGTSPLLCERWSNQK